MQPLAAVLALTLFLPILGPFLRKRNACLWTALWNFVVFLVMVVADFVSPGAYPASAMDLGLDTSLLAYPEQWYRVLTAMYVHAGALHLIMNMIVLVLMGVPFEDRVGTRRWIGIYLFSGIIGGLVNAGFVMASGGRQLGVGASGAIFGIMGAFAVLYPRDEIPMMLGFVFLNRVPVIAAVVVMGVLETLYVAAATADNVGHLVHVASLVAGAVIALPLVRMKRGDGAVLLRVDFSALHSLVRDDETRDIYERFVKEDLAQVRFLWFEQFVKKARCPRCRKGLAHVPGKFFCSCGYSLGYGSVLDAGKEKNKPGEKAGKEDN